MKFVNFIAQFFQEKGVSSSKRLVGICCSAFLCHKMYIGSHANETVVMAVASLAFGCLGLTTAEKIFRKKESENKETPTT
jgi:hypothetical protein